MTTLTPLTTVDGQRRRPVRVVAVIPAYNEEKTLADVIAAVRRVPEVAEVIVISDGSTDRTAHIARHTGVLCIELEQNVGKGAALKTGIDRAEADVYLFLDADLVGLTESHVHALLDPVLSGAADVAIGLLERGRVATDLAHVVAPHLSGQRAVSRRALEGMSGLEAARFGVEVAMTRHIKKNRLPVVDVPLGNLTHRMKEEKLGLVRGFVARLKMYWEIASLTDPDWTVSRWRTAPWRTAPWRTAPWRERALRDRLTGQQRSQR